MVIGLYVACEILIYLLTFACCPSSCGRQSFRFQACVAVKGTAAPFLQINAGCHRTPTEVQGTKETHMRTLSSSKFHTLLRTTCHLQHPRAEGCAGPSCI